MQQIAVRAMQLDGLEAEAHGALRRLAEGGRDAGQPLRIEGLAAPALRE